MKINLSLLFGSINPYRDWLLVLVFLFVSAMGIAILDAQFFLSSVREQGAEGRALSAMDLDKDALRIAAAILQEKEKRFSAARLSP